MNRFLLAIVVLLAGCVGSKEERAPPKPVEAPAKQPRAEKPAVPAVAAEPAGAPAGAPAAEPPEPGLRSAASRAANDFALRLFRRLGERREKNLISSPASVVLALGMAQAGARGPTAEELVKALGMKDEDHAWLVAAYRRLAFQLSEQGHILESANSLFAQPGLDVRPDYQNLLLQRYGAPLQELDFIHQTEASVKHINDWVSARTHGLIEKIVSKEVVNQDTRAVIANAVYLLATWNKAFDEKATAPRPFTLLSGKKRVDAITMYQRGTYAQGTFGQAEVIELPYKGGFLVMDIVLPASVAEFKRLQASLSGADLERAVADLVPATVDLHLPRFDLELEQQKLGEAMKGLGIERLFEPGKADLSGIAGQPGQLFVSEVIHGARVKVDEKGTEAAGASAVVISFKSAPQPAKVFDVNRPFLYFIRDTRTGLVLFAGHVVDPTVRN